MNSIADALPSFAIATTKANADRHAYHRQAEHMDVHGRHVHIDVFEPDPGSPSRTVLLLHGLGGLLSDAGLMRRAAKSLAANGCHVCVVHYFNATGTFFATHSNVREHAGKWQSTIAEIAQNYARLHDGPVGLLGYSLGGFLAVGAAEQTDAIGAVAVLAGGLCEEHENLAPAHLPPLLILHGAEDKRVPLDRADALVQRGRRAGALVESVVYPREGHTFGASAERDAIDRAADFFAARLEAGADR
jgi:dienelactone hydrolase